MRAEACPTALELSRAFSLGADRPLQAHLASCASCQKEWQALRELQKLSSALPQAVVDFERRNEVLTRLLSTIGAPPARPPLRRIAGGWMLALAAVSVMLCGIFFAQRATLLAKLEQNDFHWRATIRPVGTASFVHEHALHSEVVRLSSGTLQIDVDPLRPGERFRVLCHDGEIEVRGTSFTVIVDKDHLIGVVVTHGRVEVRPKQGGTISLGTGERWQSPPPSPAPSSSPALAQVAPPPLQPPPAPPTPVVRDTPPLRRSFELPPLPSPSALRQLSTETAAERAFAQGWTALRQGQYSRAAESFAKSTSFAHSETIGEDARYWRGVALARAGKRGEAIAALREFMRHHKTSPRHGEAASILGWQLLHAGQRDEAARSFQEALLDARPAIRDSAQAGLRTLAGKTSP